jgi:hypothetical protein
MCESVQKIINTNIKLYFGNKTLSECKMGKADLTRF